MSHKMHMCPRCENKVRTLYEWKGKDFCGMCQQENIERYEATIVYRFFLLLRLTKDYADHVFNQVFFPDRGWTRRFAKFIVRKTQGATNYVQGYLWRARVRRGARKDRRAEKRQHKAEGKALRKLIKTRRKEDRRLRAKILKAAR